MKKYPLKPLYLLTALCLPFTLSAQKNGFPELPKVIPSSPEAANLGKYFNYPVSYNTGLPAINIPLCEVKVGDIVLPVSISYHASGIKVNEQAGIVGLGWTLQAEPSISRKINGQEDEVGYLMNNNLRNAKNHPDYKFNIFNQAAYTDETPDDYYFKLLSKSGLFNFRKLCDTCSAFEIRTIPYMPVKIERISPTVYTITDDDGTVIRYGKSLTNADALERTDLDMITAMKATEIISASKRDTVRFDYFGDLFTHYTKTPSDVYVIEDRASSNMAFMQLYDCVPYIGTPGPNTTIESMNESIDIQKIMPVIKESVGGSFSKRFITNVQDETTWNMTPVSCASTSRSNYKEGYIVQPRVLKSIKYAEGTIEFELDGNKLSRIKVLDAAGVILRDIVFHTSFFVTTPTERRLRLDSLSIRDNSGTVAQRFVFGYHGTILPPEHSKQTDHWGYYNGLINPVTDFQSGIPRQTIYAERNVTGEPFRQLEIQIGDALKDPEETSAQAWTLTSIKFPTGGKTLFAYELNRYIEHGVPDSVKLCGGLRVKEIQEQDVNGTVALRRVFKYGKNENGGGVIREVPSLEDYYIEQTNLYYEPLFIMYDGGGGYTYSRSTNNIYTSRQRSYYSSSLQDLFYSGGAPVLYDEVTEYTMGPGNSDIGKTVYNYYINTTFGRSRVAGTSVTLQAKNHWTHGELIGKRVYRNDAGTYKLVARNEYKYSTTSFPEDKIKVNMFFTRTNIIVDRNGIVPEVYWRPYIDIPAYPYDVTPGYRYLEEETEVHYSTAGADSVSNLKKYFYGNSRNPRPLIVENSNSKGEKTIAVSTYPQEYPHDGGFIGAMQDRNILARPVEQVVCIEKTGVRHILSGSLQQYEITNPALLKRVDILPLKDPLNAANFKFSNKSAGVFPPAGTNTVFSAFSGYEQYLQFNYSGTTLTEQFKVHDMPVSYIWDYNKLHPVAEIKGAAVSECAYTGFETGLSGNWTASTARITTDAVTGRQCYNMASGSISKTGLTTGTRYLVSFWLKSGSVSVSNTIESRTGGTRNGWVLHERVVTGTSVIAVSGTGHIDDLRVHPENAQMTTYTYQPPVGVTSVTNPAYQTSFYEYDRLQRLKAIRDQDGKILKQYDYRHQVPVTQ